MAEIGGLRAESDGRSAKSKEQGNLNIKLSLFKRNSER